MNGTATKESPARSWASEILSCDHWQPSDGYGDEIRHGIKTAVAAIVVVGLLTLGAWRAKAAVDRSRAEEAARRQPPTVEVDDENRPDSSSLARAPLSLNVKVW